MNFQGANTAILIKRYVFLCLCRLGWLFINAPGELTGLDVGGATIPLPRAVFTGGSGLASIVDGALAIAQLTALLSLGRILILKHRPGFAAKLRIIPRNDRVVKPAASSSLPTALLLSSLVIFTCCFVGWAIVSSQVGGRVPFDLYVQYGGQIPLLIGIALALLGCLFGGSYIARASQQVSTSFGVVPLAPDHPLSQRISAIARKLDMSPPQVGLTDVNNAFAMGTNKGPSTVVIGRPLLTLAPDELDAIIGHELGHILTNDVSRMHFAEGFQQMLGKVIGALTIIAAILAAASAKNGRNGRSDAEQNMALSLAFGGLVRVTMFFASELIVKAISRSREFKADAVGASVTSNDAMVRALERIHQVATKPTVIERQYGYLMFRGSKVGNFFATHPTLEARVRALEARTAFSALVANAQQFANEPSALESQDELAEDLTANVERDLSDATAIKDSNFQNLGARIAGIAATATTTVRDRWNWKLLSICAAAGLAAAAVFPAVSDYYKVPDRLQKAGAAVTDLTVESTAWVAENVLGSGEEETRKAASEQIGSLQREITRLQTELNKTNEELQRRIRQAALGNTDRDKLAETVSSNEATIKKLTDERASLQADLEQARRQKVSEPAPKPTAAAEPVAASSNDEVMGHLRIRLAELTASNSRLYSEKRDIAARQRTLELEKLEAETQISRLQETIARLEQERSVPQATATATWLAAAVDGGGAVQTISNQRTRDAAESIAMKLCASSGKGCQLIGSYENACFSLARPTGHKIRSGNWWHSVDRDSWQNSEQQAVAECEQGSGAACSVRFTVCSPAGLSKPL